jgi:hypothetical protein
MIRSARVLLQWVVIAVAAALGIARLARPAPLPDYRPETWRAWDGFMAISYRAVTARQDGSCPSDRRLSEHLRALRDAGYHAIRPEDAARFLNGEAPLPDRAVLILFDGGGRKDTLLRATPVLRKTGMLATLGVQTRSTLTRNVLDLSRRELKRVARLPHWSLAGMGHDAASQIPVGPHDRRGRFLCRRVWHADAAEDDAAFASRLTADYRESLTILASAGAHPAAYVYPFADPGTSPTADPLAASVNAACVRQFFKIAFTRATEPLNEAFADPYDLTRLPIPAEWTGERLVAELERYQRLDARMDGFADSRRFAGQGLRIAAARLRMRQGGYAWLLGTRNWTDCEISAGFAPRGEGGVALYARYAGPDSYVRVTRDEHGLRVQECISNVLQTIAWCPFSPSNSPQDAIRLRVKGRRAWIWNGATAMAGPLPLSALTARGRAGLESLTTTIELQQFRAEPLAGAVAVAPTLAAIPADRLDAVQSVLRIWDPAGAAEAPGARLRDEVLAAAGRGVEIIPFIRLSTSAAGSADALAESVTAALSPPELRMFVARVAIAGGTPEHLRHLRAEGLGVVQVIARSQARRPAPKGDLPKPGEWLIIEAEVGTPAVPWEQWLRACPPWRLAAEPAEGAALPPGVRPVVRFENRKN